MAQRLLTNLDLAGNQLLNSTFEKAASDPSTDLFEGRMYFNTTSDRLKVYNGSSWEFVAPITSVSGTANEITVSSPTSDGSITISLPSTINADTTGNAATATALETARAISLGGDLSGSASFDGTANVTISATIQPDSVELGTDTTGDYVESVSAGTGISVSGTGEGAGVVVTNAGVVSLSGTTNEITVSGSTGAVTLGLPSSITVDVVGDLTGNADTATALETPRTISLGGDLSGSASFDGTSDITISATLDSGSAVDSLTGTANEIEVSASVGAITVGLPDDVTIGNDLTVSNDLVVNGDLTVSGTTTTVNTETISLADNIITLNSNATGSPTENAGIEIERGDSTNVALRWNETGDEWEATTDGSTYKTVLLSGDAASTDISDFTEASQDAVGDMVANTSTVNLTYTDATPELKADVNLAATSYLDDSAGLAIDIATLEAKLVTDSFTKKASANLGNGSNTSFAVTHNLGTRDVTVNVYDNSTYDSVIVDVVRTDVNTVTVSFATAPSSNEFRVVIVG